MTECDNKTIASRTVRIRRSHALRRSESSAKIIEATIHCLDTTGYGATSIDAVIAKAGVSKGRLLNLFPTKVDLMLAVGRYVWEFDKRQRSQVQFASPQEKFVTIIDTLWSLMSAPTGVAVFEVLVACRSDKVLAARFVPEHRQIQELAIGEVQEVLAELGLADRVNARSLHNYIEAIMRGLVLDQVFSTDPLTAPAALQFLRDELSCLCMFSGSGE